MSQATNQVIRFGVFELDARAGELRRRGMRLSVQGLPLQLLDVLLRHAGEVVTRDELRTQLWPADTFVDFDHSLHNAIARLREALGDSSHSPRFIETLPRRGYRFIGHMEGSPRAKDGEEKTHDIKRTPPAIRWPLRPFLAIGTVFVILGLGYIAYGKLLRHKNVSRIESLAVLPLRNLSGDAAQEYLADGMTEALIGRLSGIHDLRVISRTSVMRFKDTQLSVPEIARQLQVDAIVEGSVIREGSRIRVHAQLIRGATDEHFWSEAYDREMRDVLGLQSDVAQAIARKVEVTVTGRPAYRGALRLARSVRDLSQRTLCQEQQPS